MENLDTFIGSGYNQARLLAAIWRDERLYLSAKQVGLSEDDFVMPACSTVYSVLRAYREKYGKMPSTATLQDLVAASMQQSGENTEEDVREMCGVLETLTSETILDYGYAKEKLVEYIRSSRIARAASNPNDTKGILSTAHEVSEIKLEDDKDRQVSLLGDCLDILPKTDEGTDLKIPTGVPWLDFVTNGGLNASNNEIGVGIAGTGVGKALPNDDPIPTPEGWKKVGDVREGDFLFGADGKPVKVLKVHPQPEKKKIWVVKFGDGRLVRCCKDHLWQIFIEKGWFFTGKKYELLTTEQLFAYINTHKNFTLHVRSCLEVEYPDNGTTKEEADKAALAASKDDEPVDGKYLTAPVEIREWLLGGFMRYLGTDEDKQRYIHTWELPLRMHNPRLIAQILELCRSLGIEASCSQDLNYARSGLFEMRIKMRPFADPKRLMFIPITRVYETEEYADMTCFTVDAPDGLFLCDQYIVTHNTNMMINFSISAAFSGFRVLFVTLELTKKEIIRRAIGMMAHIRTSEMRLPLDKWNEKSRSRLDYLIKSGLRDTITVTDKSDKSYCVSDIVGEVEKWKRDTRKAGYDESKCKLVIIDWLDMLVPEAKDMKLIGQDWQALKKVMEDVKHMANSQNVAVWTVMQTNRQGAGAQKVRLDHVSGAYSKNFFASLVLGLAPVEEDEEDTVISPDLSAEDMQKLKTECDRLMHINILKNREGVQRESDIYQGPTLRFWQSKSAWRTVEKQLERNNMKQIFGDGISGGTKP